MGAYSAGSSWGGHGEEEVSGGEAVTPLGLALATLPLSARFGKILLLGKQVGLLPHSLALVAALSEKDPFLRRDAAAAAGGEEESDGSGQEEDLGDGGEYSAADRASAAAEGERRYAAKLARRRAAQERERLSRHPTSDALARLQVV